MLLNATEAGTGPPVVLLHGLFGQARNFGVVQRRLAVARRVIALDLRNHGASPHDLRADYGTMADDVAETLAFLGAAPCAVIGHSMGGKVAMRLALLRPDLVERLLVGDIAPAPSPPRFGSIIAAMRGLDLRPGLTRAEADAGMAAAVPEPGMRGFLLQNLRLGPAPAWGIGLAEIAAALPDIMDWPAIEGPYRGLAVFLLGERSDYVRTEDRPEIRRLFPRARFVTLRNAGHWLHADNPDGFVAVVEALLGA